jgi:hypothetical protein
MPRRGRAWLGSAGPGLARQGRARQGFYEDLQSQNQRHNLTSPTSILGRERNRQTNTKDEHPTRKTLVRELRKPPIEIWKASVTSRELLSDDFFAKLAVDTSNEVLERA